jgi:hypothetical protein
MKKFTKEEQKVFDLEILVDAYTALKLDELKMHQLAIEAAITKKEGKVSNQVLCEGGCCGNTDGCSEKSPGDSDISRKEVVALAKSLWNFACGVKCFQPEVAGFLFETLEDFCAEQDIPIEN